MFKTGKLYQYNPKDLVIRERMWEKNPDIYIPFLITKVLEMSSQDFLINYTFDGKKIYEFNIHPSGFENFYNFYMEI